MSPVPPRPDEARREQLLNEIEAIFLSEGFLQSRVGVLADRLHCSRSTLYKLAPSKEQLFVLVVERYADNAVRAAIKRSESFESPFESISAFIEEMAVRQQLGSAAFWADAISFGPTAERFKEERSWGVAVMRDLIERGIASGAMRPANASFITHVLWRGVVATRDAAVLERAGLDIQGAVRELGSFLFSGLGYPPLMDAKSLEGDDEILDCA